MMPGRKVPNNRAQVPGGGGSVQKMYPRSVPGDVTLPPVRTFLKGGRGKNPRSVFFANGYPCFVVSIAMIGVCTAVIGDVAGHLGCFIFLKDSVNAIAFVALGTSVPGTDIVLL